MWESEAPVTARPYVAAGIGPVLKTRPAFLGPAALLSFLKRLSLFCNPSNRFLLVCMTLFFPNVKSHPSFLPARATPIPNGLSLLAILAVSRADDPNTFDFTLDKVTNAGGNNDMSTYTYNTPSKADRKIPRWAIS